MYFRSSLIALRAGLVFFLTSPFASSGENPDEPCWRKHTINDQFPFEAAGAADFNGDGRLDVFSGDSWYEAPQWTRHIVRQVLPGTNPHYYEDFADLPLDVHRDGHVDIVTSAYFRRRIACVEHPGVPRKPWIEHTIDLPGSMETGQLVDLNRDGTPDLLPNRLAVSLTQPALNVHTVSRHRITLRLSSPDDRLMCFASLHQNLLQVSDRGGVEGSS